LIPETAEVLHIEGFFASNQVLDINGFHCVFLLLSKMVATIAFFGYRGKYLSYLLMIKEPLKTPIDRF